MRKKIALLSVITLSGCGITSTSQPKLDINPYLTPKEREVVNDITFEVQKVLDTIDGFKNSKALDFVTKLTIPGWNIEKREEKILFLTQKKFITYKDFSLPPTCIKNIGGAEVNVCHMKLSVNLSRLGEAFGCEVKTYSGNWEGLKERIKIICSY